jgi:hypothetical protein
MVFWSIVAVVLVMALAAVAWWWSGRSYKPLPRLDKDQVQAEVINKTGPPRIMPPPMSG